MRRRSTMAGGRSAPNGADAAPARRITGVRGPDRGTGFENRRGRILTR
jgi:hypothetical protein